MYRKEIKTYIPPQHNIAITNQQSEKKDTALLHPPCKEQTTESTGATATQLLFTSHNSEQQPWYSVVTEVP